MTTSLAKHEQKLTTYTVDQLREELSKAITVTADHLRYLAAVWRELESRGEDLSHLKTGLVGYLPMIANGQMDPQLIIKYAGRRTVLTALSKLPIEEQRQIAEDGHVTLVTLDEDGNRQDLQRPLEQLSPPELHQVVGEDGLRNPDRQFLLLANRKPRKRSSKNTVRTIKVEDRGGDTFFSIGAKRIREDYLLRELAKFYEIDEEILFSTLKGAV